MCIESCGQSLHSLSMVPVSFGEHGIKTIIGIASSLGAIALLGLHDDLNKFSSKTLREGSKNIVAEPFAHAVTALNKNAFESKTVVVYNGPSYTFRSGAPTISSDGDGFITHFVKAQINSIATDLSKSGNCFKKHILARLTYMVAIVASAITRAVDAVIGVIAAAFSFITLGNFNSLNNLAFRGLQAPRLISDILFYARKILNVNSYNLSH